jgi:hypothetical protein
MGSFPAPKPETVGFPGPERGERRMVTGFMVWIASGASRFGSEKGTWGGEQKVDLRERGTWP